MEALLAVVVLLAGCSGFWLGSRSSGRTWQRHASATAELVDRLEHDVTDLRVTVAQRDHDLARAVDHARQAQERQDALTRELLERAQAERERLLDRLTMAADPVSEPLVGRGRKLHYTEADEIEGTTPGMVAAAARAAATAAAGQDIDEAEQVLGHIDELAYAEGVKIQ